MGATTQRIGTTPKQTEGLRTGVIDYLSGRSGPDSPFGRITAAGPPAAAPWQGTAINRGMVRDVTSRDTQSVDQLGGANSAFFQNMMSQLRPAFDTQRQLAAAQGSESAGNLTGSGFANRLGSALGRSLGAEQAMLADYAFKGMGLEQQRQAADADRLMRGDLANQGMDSSFINQLLQGDQNSLAARGQDVTMRGQDMNLADANAGRFAGLLGQQAGLGVAPDEIIQKGGIGELLGPLGAMLGMGGVGQGGLGGVLGQIFGGGQGGAGGGGMLGGLTNVLTGNKGGSQVIGIGANGMPIFAPVQQNGVQSVLSQILGKGGLGGMIGSAGIGAATGGGLGGALGGMAGGRLLGGALGSLIPIPGVGTALGSALGGWAAPKIGGAVKKVGGWLGDRLGFNDQKKKSSNSLSSSQQMQQQQMQALAPLLQMLFSGGGGIGGALSQAGRMTPPITPTFPGGYQQIPINPVYASA